MLFADYEKEAARTRADTAHGLGLYRDALGLVGEVGEVVDLAKKTIFHGHPFSKETFVRELGDVLWYVAAFADDSPSLKKAGGLGSLLAVAFDEGEGEDRLSSIGSFAEAEAFARRQDWWMSSEDDWKSADRCSDVLAFASYATRVVLILERSRDYEPMDFVPLLRTLLHMIDVVGASLEEVALANVAKLRARYPDGFSSLGSLVRKEGDS